jgi:F-type H+-transporting ATPase subunit delta
MNISIVAKRYGKALFEVAQGKNLLTDVENDLQLIAESIENSSFIVDWLSHPAVQLEQKKAVFQDSFPNIQPVTKNFLFLLIDERREGELASIATEYHFLAFEAAGLAEAVVTTAFPMTSNEKEELVNTFEPIVDKKLVLEEQVDPDILGGVIVQVGDRLYDGSLRTKLLRFQERLNA